MGPLDFSLIGILAKISQLMAHYQISIFAISTYDTDYMKEKVPSDLMKYVPEKNKCKHHWSHWRYLSTQLKSVHPKYFYKKISIDAHTSLKEYVQALTIEGV